MWGVSTVEQQRGADVLLSQAPRELVGTRSGMADVDRVEGEKTVSQLRSVLEGGIATASSEEKTHRAGHFRGFAGEFACCVSLRCRSTGARPGRGSRWRSRTPRPHALATGLMISVPGAGARDQKHRQKG